MKPMMKCGHRANAVHGENNDPCCAICACGGSGNAYIVDDSPPNLEGRTARCAYYGSTPTGRNHEGPAGCERGKPCLCKRSSTDNLAFFKHQPDKEYDQFYCGCWGWD